MLRNFTFILFVLTACGPDHKPAVEAAQDPVISIARPTPEAQLEARSRALLARVATIPTPRSQVGGEFLEIVHAKLAVADRTNDVIPLRDLNHDLRYMSVEAVVGTHFDGFDLPLSLGDNVCQHPGDYDMMLRQLIAIAYTFGPRGPAQHQNKLEADVYDRIVNSYLTMRGGAENVRTQVSVCEYHVGMPEIIVPETENHVLMTETARYLTNQLLRERAPGEARFDNTQNGMRAHLLGRMHAFMRDDFYEYNSRPYALHSLLALQNLYDFAEDDDVRTGAQLVLDYLAAKFALSSNELRANRPFRRRPENAWAPNLLGQNADEHMHWFTLLAGTPTRFPALDVRGWDKALVTIATTKYRLPRAIRELALDKSGFRYFQRFAHDTAEIYASTPDYLISAGGEHTPAAFSVPHTWNPLVNAIADALNSQAGEEGIAAYTTLIPTGGPQHLEQLIHFRGHSETNRRKSTCEAPDFACGLQLVIPNRYLGCGVRDGHWMFIDASCAALGESFYAAIYDDGAVQFMEVSPASAMPFEAFRSEVHAANDGRGYDVRGVNEHQTVSGNRILFTPDPGDSRPTIHAIGDRYFDAIPMSEWPSARGDVMNGDDGFFEITHPTLGDRIVLDFRNPSAPSRSEVSGTSWPAIGGPLTVSRDPMAASGSFTVIREERSQRLMLLGIGTDHGLYYKYQSGALDWDGWQAPPYGNGYLSRIAAVSRSHATMIYGIGSDQHVYVRRAVPDWTSWQMIPRGGGVRAVDLDVVPGTNADHTVVVVDDQGEVYLQDAGDPATQMYWLHGAAFSGWFPMGRPDAAPIRQVSLTNAGGRLHLVGLGDDGSLWRRRQIIELRTTWVWDWVYWESRAVQNEHRSWGPWQRISEAQFCTADMCIENRIVQVEAGRAPGGQRLAIVAVREDGRVLRAFVSDTDDGGATAFDGFGSGVTFTALPFATPITQIAMSNNGEGGPGMGRLEVFGLDRAGRVWNVWQATTTDDGTWHGPASRPDDRPLTALTAAVNAWGPIEIFGIDPQSGIVRHDWQQWGGWYR